VVSEPWVNTTHDWAGTVDVGHLAEVRREPGTFAPGGVSHLILEVLAYAADEAEASGVTGQCRVTLHADGSVSVADDGRGTDTRFDAAGRPVKKPVMATKDLRFFDSPDAEQLPDGHPRRGMSVVAALSSWLVHENRRRNGAWTQRYEYGVPVTDLVAMPAQDATGTTVHFLPDDSVRPGVRLMPLLTAGWPRLKIQVFDERR
jgi:topoisomerase IV subunit B